MINVTWNGDKFINELQAQLQQTLLRIGSDLQNRSVNMAPEKTGVLRRSCVIDPAGLNNPQKPSIEVGYAPSVDHYSVVQHEHTEFIHPKAGEAKYLEKPFNAHKEQYFQAIINTVRSVTKQ